MDIGLLFGSAWRHKWLMLVAVLVGFSLAFSSLYKVHYDAAGSPGQRLKLSDRSTSVYESEIQLMLFDPAFGISRAGQDYERVDSFRRAVELAPTYAHLALSDPVIASIESTTGPVDVVLDCQSVEKSPLLAVKVIGSDAARVVEIADSIAPAFQSYLTDEQNKYEVPVYDRMAVRQLAEPSPPVARVTRGAEYAAIAFIAPIMIALSIVYILENMRRNRALASQDSVNAKSAARAPADGNDCCDVEA